MRLPRRACEGILLAVAACLLAVPVAAVTIEELNPYAG
jgi:hypothetical protein